MNRYLIEGRFASYEISRDRAIDIEVNGYRSTRRDNIFGGVDYVFKNVPIRVECDTE